MTRQRQAIARGAKRSPLRPAALAAAVIGALGATGAAQAFVD
jgi:hypothetical protein